MAKQLVPEPRGARLNRYQTSAFGAYIATAVDAHFDPYLEPRKEVGLSAAAMERVAKVVIP